MGDVFENTVRYEETDAQGIVFYGNYLTYQDESFTEYMETIGYPYDGAWAANMEMHVVNINLNYHAPAQFRDELINSMRVSTIGESSLEFDYRCRRTADKKLLVEGSATFVAVDGDGQTIHIPDDLRDAINNFQDEPPNIR